MNNFDPTIKPNCQKIPSHRATTSDHARKVRVYGQDRVALWLDCKFVSNRRGGSCTLPDQPKPQARASRKLRIKK